LQQPPRDMVHMKKALRNHSQFLAQVLIHSLRNTQAPLENQLVSTQPDLVNQQQDLAEKQPLEAHIVLKLPPRNHHMNAAQKKVNLTQYLNHSPTRSLKST